MKLKSFYAIIILFLFSTNCKVRYSQTGINIGDAKTFQVNLFENNANLIEPGIHRDLTLNLQDFILNQTPLQLVKSNGDIFYEGEISEYRISPTTATSQNTAAQNRLTVSAKIHFINKIKNKEFDKVFSFFQDYPANSQLTGNLKNEIHQDILNRLSQDIVNASLDDW
ncbi:LptE family protein [Hyunsoonleella sp. SJ7]|uniref:LptE family protein n=1 Tax=Hyunsoonleella aquatilis TaxID=2762758 RepID=A0A923H7E3_9FLAO|nr:LptE family protein [Hyunsoonleella aquatilis]MBC3757951.1 LptE family protein [Hyunsoonleella aquatilis]